MKKWYAIIGDPINQSMSPDMHDEWLDENNINASYIPIHVRGDNLTEAIASLKSLGCSGWNVTVPHKTAIIPLLDEIDSSATLMDAVNTVEVLDDGSLLGLNTDGEGFVRSLEEVCDEQCKGREILIIGAGGAARGISFALHEAGYGPIAFTNRTIERAENLSAEIPGSTVLSITEAEATLSSFGLIVQTTTVGMNSAQKGIPLNLENMISKTIVVDIIYNPLETEFLTEARKRGAIIVNGVGMLVHQGSLSFEKWTGVQPNTETMIKKITSKLGGSYVIG